LIVVQIVIQTSPVINSPDTVLCLFYKQEDQINYIAENISLGRLRIHIPAKECPECLYWSMGAVNLDHRPESWQCVMCGYFTNEPERFNNIPGGLLKKNIGKPDRRIKIRWSNPPID